MNKLLSFFKRLLGLGTETVDAIAASFVFHMDRLEKVIADHTVKSKELVELRSKIDADIAFSEAEIAKAETFGENLRKLITEKL